jgi:hypothetical protein
MVSMNILGKHTVRNKNKCAKISINALIALSPIVSNRSPIEIRSRL